MVVGAGIAGLTAPIACTRPACRCGCSRARTGSAGACAACATSSPRTRSCELGGELVDTNHEAHARRSCGELGLALDDFEQDDPAAGARRLVLRRPAHRRRRGGRSVPAHRRAKIDAAWETVTGESVTYKEPNGGEAIDTHVDRRSGSTRPAPRAGSASCSTSPTPPSTAWRSASSRRWNLLMMIDTNPEPFRVFGESDERFHIRGGNDQIPTRARRRARRPRRDRHAARGARRGRRRHLRAGRCARGADDATPSPPSASCSPCRSPCCARCGSTSSCRRSSARRSRSWATAPTPS